LSSGVLVLDFAKKLPNRFDFFFSLALDFFFSFSPRRGDAHRSARKRSRASTDPTHDASRRRRSSDTHSFSFLVR